MRREPGFTLLEVLVAFAVFASTMAAVMGSVGSSLRDSRVSAHQAIATLIAESRITATGIETPLLSAEPSGVTPEGYRWRITAEPIPLEADEDRTVLPERPYRVTVVVAWSDGRRERSVELQTLRYVTER